MIYVGSDFNHEKINVNFLYVDINQSLVLRALDFMNCTLKCTLKFAYRDYIHMFLRISCLTK